MLNQTVIVGRLVKAPELKLTDNGKKVSNITLAVPRSFKNVNGIYDTDFIDCTLWSGVAESTAEYCTRGDLLGVKGRVQTATIETDEGAKRKVTEIVAEKVTFLSSKSGIDKNEETNSADDETPVEKTSEKSKK